MAAPPSRAASPDAARSERGSALVDYVLVSALVMLLVAGVLQLTLALHVRNTLVDCAGEGARHAALDGVPLEAGAERTRELISTALSADLIETVEARAVNAEGMDLVRVEVQARLPVLGLLGPGGSLTARGHAVVEG